MTKVEFRWDQGEKRVMIPSKTYLYLQVYELLILPETIDHNARSYSFILLSNANKPYSGRNPIQYPGEVLDIQSHGRLILNPSLR